MSTFNERLHPRGGNPNNPGQWTTKHRAEAEPGILSTAPTQPETDADVGVGEFTVGDEPERIPAAEARRRLPTGTRVQVVYLGGQRAHVDGSPDIRIVTKQSRHEMTTAGPATEEFDSHLRWANCRADTDHAGTIMVSDPDGHPSVAYIPLDGHDQPGGFNNPTVTMPVVEHMRAAETSEDPHQLDALAFNDRAAVRTEAAQNPSTGPVTLTRLAADDSHDTQQAVLQHSNTGPEALSRLSRSDHSDIRYEAARHPVTDRHDLARIAADDDYDNTMCRAAVAENPNCPADLLNQLSHDPDWPARSAVARNRNTSPETLDRLARSGGHGDVMSAAAGNPNTPSSTLEHLSGDTSTGNTVRSRVAANPSTPNPIVDQSAADPDPWIREHAASNPNLNPGSHQQLADDPNSQVRRSLARNPSCNPTIRDRLASDPDPLVQKTAAKHSTG